MKILTPAQIAEIADKRSKAGGNITIINKLFREQDESHLWPICGRFNATERAIRRARDIRRETGPIFGLEYAMLVDSIIGEIVNDSKNLPSKFDNPPTIDKIKEHWPIFKPAYSK